ncbi:MAG TPA: GNAT family N-acetyltransferase [Desulfomonilia bacterium]
MKTHTLQSSQQSLSSDYVSTGEELHLSNTGQLELLTGMMERGVSLRTMVRGFSMYPFIRDGDVLTISPVNGRKLSPGDVVAFVKPETGRLAVHRVISRARSGFLIRGDNCSQTDGTIMPENILGYVTKIERYGRNVRLGLGFSGILISILNRDDFLLRLKRLYFLPRRAAGRVLIFLQGFPFYRRFGRRLSHQIVIEEASESDMEAVHNRLNPYDLYRRQPYNPDVTNWIARRSGKVIGFIQFVYHPEEHFPWVGFWLFSLNVWSLYRGTGIGEKLVKRGIEKAVEMGAKELYLVVYEDNRRAINLYGKLGFVRTEVKALEPLFSSEQRHTGLRRIVMKKDLI